MRKAFTMLELVIVMIVVGILASIALQNANTGSRPLAMNSMLSALRYTKTLALNDMKISADDDDWSKKLWQIRFGSCPDGSLYYIIGADKNGDGTIQESEAAISPATGKRLWDDGTCSSGNKEVNMALTNLSSATFGGACAGASSLGFDHMGRPFKDPSTTSSDYGHLMKDDCEITFSFSGGESPFKVKVHGWTGMIEVEGKNL